MKTMRSLPSQLVSRDLPPGRKPPGDHMVHIVDIKPLDRGHEQRQVPGPPIGPVYEVWCRVITDPFCGRDVHVCVEGRSLRQLFAVAKAGDDVDECIGSTVTLRIDHAGGAHWLPNPPYSLEPRVMDLMRRWGHAARTDVLTAAGRTGADALTEAQLRLAGAGLLLVHGKEKGKGKHRKSAQGRKSTYLEYLDLRESRKGAEDPR